MPRRRLGHKKRSSGQPLDLSLHASGHLSADMSPSVRFDDWEVAEIGNRVLMQRPGDAARVGTLEDMSDDGSVVWVRLDALGRILITRDDDVTLHKTDRQ